MAIHELDPVFVKALHLMKSKNSDAINQLRNMLNDVIAQRKGIKPSAVIDVKSVVKSEDETSKKREAEKRPYEKLKPDASESNQDIKKPRKETSIPQDKDSKYSKDSSKDKDRDKEREKIKKEIKEREKSKVDKKLKEKEKEKSVEKVNKEKTKDVEKEPTKVKAKSDTLSDEETSVDVDDFAFGLGISCVVCRQFAVSPGNQLVECQECHSLYHQECHRPTVVEQDVTDPRFVWYCFRCSKANKKMVSKPQKAKPGLFSGSTSLSSSSSVKEPSAFVKPVVVKTESTSATVQPFRRMEHKTSTSKEVSSSSNSKPLSGLASLADKLSGKNVEILKSSSKSESGRTDTSKSSAHKQDTGKLHDSNKPAKTDSSKSSSALKSEPMKAFSALKSDLTKLAVSKNEDRSAFGSALSKMNVKPMNTGSNRSALFLGGKAASSLSSGSNPSKLTSSFSSSKSLSSSGKTAPPTATAAATAEKRLQMMKKKAAAAKSQRLK